jgi:hypothetical protein
MTDRTHSTHTLAAFIVALVLGVLGSAAPMAAPVANQMERARAERVVSMPDVAPSDRINQLLAARDFNDAELFALAATHPVIVEHFTPGDLALGANYLFSLPGAELHKMRTGGTLIRPIRKLSSKEKFALRPASKEMGVPHEKLTGVKIGPKDGRNYIVELTYQIKRKKTATFDIELVPPPTPERDETARSRLTKHFGARPSRAGRGVGSSILIKDNSFESEYSLSDGWRLEQGRMLGAPTPTQEVMLDERIAIDGLRSLRFYATERTRVFQKVVQEVKVQPGLMARFRVQHKAENVRVEFQQYRSDYKVQLTYLSNGVPIGAPLIAKGRLGTHVWELLEISERVPANATEARIELVCSLSGTAWFDGLVFEVIESEGGW